MAVHKHVSGLQPCHDSADEENGDADHGGDNCRGGRCPDHNTVSTVVKMYRHLIMAGTASDSLRVCLADTRSQHVPRTGATALAGSHTATLNGRRKPVPACESVSTGSVSIST